MVSLHILQQMGSLWQFCNTLHASLLVQLPQKLRKILEQLPESTGRELCSCPSFHKVASLYPIENVNRETSSVWTKLNLKNWMDCYLIWQYLHCTGNLGFIWIMPLLSGISVALAEGKLFYFYFQLNSLRSACSVIE